MSVGERSGNLGVHGRIVTSYRNLYTPYLSVFISLSYGQLLFIQTWRLFKNFKECHLINKQIKVADVRIYFLNMFVYIYSSSESFLVIWMIIFHSIWHFNNNVPFTVHYWVVIKLIFCSSTRRRKFIYCQKFHPYTHQIFHLQSWKRNRVGSQILYIQWVQNRRE